MVHTPRAARTGPRCAVLALLALVAAACTSGPAPPDEGSHAERIAAERELKERMFRDPSESPIPAGREAEFLPLSYYAVDESYAVPAALKLADERPVFEMPTSTGKLRKMERVGVLAFTLMGQPMSLGAFVEAGTARIARLFVPFSDLTTGTETYAAGRYLDIDPTSTGLYEIDFNRAYNPYCVYNESYDCPYPPPSNRLKVPVRAGERMRVAEGAAPDSR